MLWVQRNPQYFDARQGEVRDRSGRRLVAYSMVHGTIVVTNERPAGFAKPRAAARRLRQFNVLYKDTFVMLGS